MQNSKILEMLNKEQYEELKLKIQDEIYKETLKKKPGAKPRYAAMKKYLKNISSAREILQKPCEIEYEGEKFISFCNSFSLAFTRESVGEIELCDEPERYPNVARIVTMGKNEIELNLTKVIAEAKSKGYKYKKSEIHNNKYLMLFGGSYYRIGLIDITYGIINDGGKSTVYYSDDKYRPIVIKNDIGICMVMPVRIDGDLDDCIVIEV